MAYFPLNVQTGYTFLSSALKIPSYVKKGKELGFTHLGISDINPYAYKEFETFSKKENIIPIFGIRISFYFHNQLRNIHLYIESEEGYLSLCHITSLIDEDIYLGDFSNVKGLICIVPMLTSNFFFNEEDEKERMRMLMELKSFFSSFYIGTECYTKEDIEKLNEIYALCDQYDFKTVAFSKTLCLKKEDGLTLDILEAIKNDTKLSDYEEKSTPYFLLSETSCRKIYREKDFLFFIEHDFSSFTLQKKRGELYKIQNIDDKKEKIYELAKTFLSKNNKWNELYEKRLNYELDVISKMGYLDYFLIVSDYVNYAKNHGILVGPGRGSASGSLVSYALSITEADPLKYDLLFERFLNPERISMPDIDVDFIDYHREDIIAYISSHYGEDKVSKIIAFQTFGPKQAIQDIGRVFSFNPSDIKLLSNSIDSQQKTFLDAYKFSPSFKELVQDEHYKLIASLARRIEGLPRQKGLHASGIIINNKPLKDVLPMFGKNSPAPYEGNYLEELGFLKMDILGIRNLTIIENVLNRINQKDLKLENIPLDDKKTLEILNNGLTKGIFQLEGDGITDSLKEIGVDSFNDIIAINALYRPGPMEHISHYAKRKKHLEKIPYIDSRLEPILKETYGIIVYQEQIMRIVQDVASFSLGKADILRRAISKKSLDLLVSLKKDFIDGAKANGLNEKNANKIYDYILEFANYGFNKSHSVSYALFSYRMAYLKSHFPKEFFSALLDMQKSSPNYSQYTNELRYFSLEILPPDINLSEQNFKVEEKGIRIPLSAIKGFSSNLEKALLEERKNGSFTSLSDLFLRSKEMGFSEQNYLALVNAGALDIFKLNRQTLRKAVKTYMLFANNIEGIKDLTPEERKLMEPKIISLKEDNKLKYQLEFETLGILLSGSLFSEYEKYFAHLEIHNIAYAYKNKDQLMTIPAVISSVRIIKTRNKEDMEILQVYDEKDQVKVVIFPKIYKTIPYIVKGDVILISGTLKQDDKGTSFIASEIIKMEVKDE